MNDDELYKIYQKAFEDYIKRKKQRELKIKHKKSAYRQTVIIIVDLVIITAGAFLALTNIQL